MILRDSIYGNIADFWDHIGQPTTSVTPGATIMDKLQRKEVKKMATTMMTTVTRLCGHQEV